MPSLAELKQRNPWGKYRPRRARGSSSTLNRAPRCAVDLTADLTGELAGELDATAATPESKPPGTCQKLPTCNKPARHRGRCQGQGWYLSE